MDTSTNQRCCDCVNHREDDYWGEESCFCWCVLSETDFTYWEGDDTTHRERETPCPYYKEIQYG